MPTSNPTTFQQAVANATDQVLEVWRFGHANNLDWRMHKELEQLVAWFHRGFEPAPYAKQDLRDRFTYMAAGVIDVINHDQGDPVGGIVRNCQDLMARKQHDYGHGNILAFGMKGVIVRLSDKCARLENLSTKDGPRVAESIRDTLDDMIGYCLIGLMLLDGTFTLPLAPIDTERTPSSPHSAAGWANCFDDYNRSSRAISGTRWNLPA